MSLVTNKSISIIFPAYNEEKNITNAVVQAVNYVDSLFQDWEIIIVNDGSQDRTGEIIDRLALENPRVIAVHHQVNHGYGTALRSGIQRARKELIFFSDSDLQFHLTELLLLVAWIEQYDIVIGYRAKRRDPFYRKLNALGWNILVRLLLGLKVKDIDCAFKIFRSDLFKVIKIDAVGAMVNTDILVQATQMGFKIKEVPVTHFSRIHGKQTGADIRVILKAFKELFRLYFKLRSISSIVIPCNRRREHNIIAINRRHSAEQRKVFLPINFPDRRRGLILAPKPQTTIV